mgnify:CR=1 FL=1
MVRTCVECGKTFLTHVPSKKTCSDECANMRRRRYAIERNAERRQATRERLGTRICLTCGKEFAPSNSNKVCCSSECQKVRDRELVNASNRSIRQRNKKAKSSEQQINDINAKAKAMGLSYGQYVARYGG